MDQCRIVHGLPADGHDGGWDVCDFGKPFHADFLRVTDQPIDFPDVLPDGKAVLGKF